MPRTQRRVKSPANGFRTPTPPPFIAHAPFHAELPLSDGRSRSHSVTPARWIGLTWSVVMYKAIIFDLGKVLVHFDFKRSYRALESLCPHAAADIPKLLAPTG